MINFRFSILLAVICFLPPAVVFGQEIRVDTCLSKRDDAYMNRQDKAFLEEIDQTLAEYPPAYPLEKPRYLSLLLMDAVMHDPYAAFRKPVQKFYHKRIENALHELETTTVKEGAMIWKLYNMGFIVRTKSVTLAFDLVSGESSRSEKFALSRETMQRLADQCDVLFISHRHRDHVDMGTANAFIQAGKPVVAPPQVWSGQAIYSSITHLKRDANLKQPLKIKNGETTLQVVIFPGHQMSNTENNVSLVYTPEGITVCHMGDQINEGNFMIDYQWIDHVSEHYEVDILLPPCWTNEIYRIVKGFDPGVVIPGHENELGHGVYDRVPFWGDSEFLELTYPELKASGYPLILMMWGESYHYQQ